MTLLPTVRSAVPSIRFWCSVKAFGAYINVNGVGAGDVMGNEVVLAEVDMMLNCLALYLM